MNIAEIANQCFAVEVQLNLKKIGLDEVKLLLERLDAYLLYKSHNSDIFVREEPEVLPLEQRNRAVSAIELSARGDWVHALNQLRVAFLNGEDGIRDFTKTESLYFSSVVRIMFFHFHSLF